MGFSLKNTVIYSLLLVLLTAHSARSAEITLVNGNVIRGEVIERTDDYIKISSESGVEVTYFTEEIAAFREDLLSYQGAENPEYEEFKISNTVSGLPFTKVKTLSVLFIGNSYTDMNNMPDMFAQLVKATGNDVHVDTVAKPGWQLSQHADSQDTLNKIQSRRWDYVVLQDQSILPTKLVYRRGNMTRAVKTLDQAIRASGGKTVMFMTWGYRKGDPGDGLKDKGFKDYTTMQASLYSAYMGVAKYIDAIVAPVGRAWTNVLKNQPKENLWQSDNSHPSRSGSYLTACVFYAVIYRSSPVGINYTAGFSPSKAEFFQKIAKITVLNHKEKWNLSSSAIDH